MPDTDKELLERAARAAGIEIWRWNEFTGKPVIKRDGVPVYWSPLTDDGDALRLAVKLKISVYFETSIVLGQAVDIVEVTYGHDEMMGTSMCVAESYEDDADETTRRAIVRAAASLAMGE